MIEGGGLGVYAPDEIGPVERAGAERRHRHGGARRGRGRSPPPKNISPISRAPCRNGPAPISACCAPPFPENRLRVYDIRAVVATLADADSVLELRAGFGVGIVTALVRIEGRPFGLIANNPLHLGGAIDAEAVDKAARFVQLCDATTCRSSRSCDTPGFMVGPEAEKDRAGAPRLPHVRHRRQPRPCPISRSCCARATGSARRRWRPAASTPRPSPCRGRPASSAAWGSKARCASAIRKELAAIADPDGARGRVPPPGRPKLTSAARRSTSPRCSRSTTSSTRRKRGAGSCAASMRWRRARRAQARNAPRSSRGKK